MEILFNPCSQCLQLQHFHFKHYIKLFQANNSSCNLIDTFAMEGERHWRKKQPDFIKNTFPEQAKLTIMLKTPSSEHNPNEQKHPK